MRTNEYTVRSEGGGITRAVHGLNEAMSRARALAIENEGQTFHLLQANGRPVRHMRQPMTWTCGPKAEVQR